MGGRSPCSFILSDPSPPLIPVPTPLPTNYFAEFKLPILREALALTSLSDPEIQGAKAGCSCVSFDNVPHQEKTSCRTAIGEGKADKAHALCDLRSASAKRRSQQFIREILHFGPLASKIFINLPALGIPLARSLGMLSQDVQTERHEKATRANVLIVEDERVSRRALAALMAASGYETEAAGSAEEALDVVHAGTRPDIALVDLDLPGMNGLDFIGRLTQLDPAVFPVLITAANGERLSSLLADRGVAYLRKPLDFDRLLSIIGDKAPN